MKRAIINTLGGLAMLLSACGGTQRQDTVSETESESHDGFEFQITYSPRGFTIEGEDRHNHNAFYSWRSLDRSGHLYLIRDDSASILDDNDSNGFVDAYSGPDMFFDMNDSYVGTPIHRQLQGVYDEHLRELPVRHAQEQWNQRWQSENTPR